MLRCLLFGCASILSSGLGCGLGLGFVRLLFMSGCCCAVCCFVPGLLCFCCSVCVGVLICLIELVVVLFVLICLCFGCVCAVVCSFV